MSHITKKLKNNQGMAQPTLIPLRLPHKESRCNKHSKISTSYSVQSYHRTSALSGYLPTINRLETRQSYPVISDQGHPLGTFGDMLYTKTE